MTRTEGLGLGARDLGRRRKGAACLGVVSVLLAGAVLVASSTGTQAPSPRPQASSSHRIISLVPAVTEMLFAIGAGDDVVGVSSFDHYPAAVETRPRVGALVDPDFERILSLRPDLVVVYGTQTDLIARLGRAHLAVFSYTHAGLADITQTMRTLGARIGREEAANREASRIEQALAAIRASVANRPRPRTALVFNRDAGALRGIFVSGGIGFMNDMLDTAGGTNVFADVRRQNLQASAEVLIARAPDVILELRPNEGWSPERLLAEVAVWNGLPSLPAVRTHRVYILAGDKLLVPGPRVVEAVRLISDTLMR